MLVAEAVYKEGRCWLQELSTRKADVGWLVAGAVYKEGRCWLVGYFTSQVYA